MPATDFDFLPGVWRVANRKLADTLDPDCTEWEEFEATSEARAMLGGLGNVDHFRADGYEGFSLRLYDPDEDLWRIWWSSTAAARPPRSAGRGPLRRRRQRALRMRRRARGACRSGSASSWSGITETSARWEQAFSFDGGRTWKPNWIMLLTR